MSHQHLLKQLLYVKFEHTNAFGVNTDSGSYMGKLNQDELVIFICPEIDHTGQLYFRVLSRMGPVWIHSGDLDVMS